VSSSYEVIARCESLLSMDISKTGRKDKKTARSIAEALAFSR
jgi:hypothetical protein